MGISSGGVEISDAELARVLIREVAGPRGPDEPKKTLMGKAFERLFCLNAAWTERRVRALWAGEAARVEHREIREMERAIAEQQKLEEARREHADFIARTDRMEALGRALKADRYRDGDQEMG